jgi:hypothetical protein
LVVFWFTWVISVVMVIRVIKVIRVILLFSGEIGMRFFDFRAVVVKMVVRAFRGIRII